MYILKLNKLLFYFLVIFFINKNEIFGQNIGINSTGATPDNSAILDVSASDRGLLVPRIFLSSTIDAIVISSPATSLLIWNTNASITNGAGVGYYYNSNTPALPIWVKLISILDLPSTGETLDQAYDFGGAGIGRSITADAGALKIQGTDGFLVTGVMGSGTDVEIIGAGTRMFFNPQKAAFRVGEVSGNEWNNDSIGTHSFASGYNNKAIGNFSTAFGYGNKAFGVSSIVTGDHSIASGDISIAMGSNITASGDHSIAMGYNTKATGNYTTAIGHSTQATQFYSTAMGFHSIASGDASIAMGNFSKASGASSTAMGYSSQALGDYSTAMGDNTLASSYGEIALGRYNASIGTPTSWVTTDNLFVIGNGIDDLNRNEAFTVLKNGKTGIGRNPTTNALEVNGDASKTTSGTWLANSDQRLKKNIQTIPSDYALQKLLQLRGVTYEWNDDKTGYTRPKGIQIGFIAQEIQKVFPEKVKEDGQGYLQTAYGDYDPLYVQALKELNDKINLLESENKKLTEELTKMNELEKRILSLEKK